MTSTTKVRRRAKNNMRHKFPTTATMTMGFKAHSRPSTTRPIPRYNHLRTNARKTEFSSWRENFKQSCLERARRNREIYVKTKRQSARELMEEELEESGVLVGESKKRKGVEELAAGEEYSISEDDLYALMQEIEEELQRDGTWYAPREEFHLDLTAELMRPLPLTIEDRLVEELEELDRYEEQFRELIEDYDDWKEPIDTNLVCPVCMEGNLRQSESIITCSNYMSGHCTLRIETPSEMYTLGSLRDQLGVAFAEHDVACSGRLEMQVRRSLVEDGGQSLLSLMGQCHTCGTNLILF